MTQPHKDPRERIQCDEHEITWKHEHGAIWDQNYVIPGECEKCDKHFQLTFIIQGVWDLDEDEYLKRL
jgi:hypothetical protein